MKTSRWTGYTSPLERGQGCVKYKIKKITKTLTSNY